MHKSEYRSSELFREDVAFLMERGYRSAPQIVDFILGFRFPSAVEAAKNEGVVLPLRQGLIKSARQILKKSGEKDLKRHLEAFDADVVKLASLLQSTAYFVPYQCGSGGEYVHLTELLEDLDLLNVAVKVMQEKVREVRSETLLLQALHSHLLSKVCA